MKSIKGKYSSEQYMSQYKIIYPYYFFTFNMESLRGISRFYSIYTHTIWGLFHGVLIGVCTFVL